MQSLPTELVHEIISYVPVSDLPALRLTHTSFTRLTNEFMFRSTPIEVTHEGLSNGLSIIQNPAISKSVQEIVFIGPRGKQSTSKAVPRETSSDFASEIERLRTERRFRESKEFIEILAAMFRILPELRSIRIRGYLLFNEEHHKMNWAEEMEIYRARENYYFNVFVGAVNAAFEADISLREFRCCGAMAQDIYSDTETLRRAKKVFSGCRALELFFAADSEREYPSLQDYENAVYAVISSALQLESLRLGFNTPSEIEDASIPLSALLGEDFVWPCLKEIQLSWIDIHDHELLHLLKRHAATLEVFGIKNTLVLSGSWTNIAKMIKGEMMVLKEFTLVNEVWEWNWSHRYTQEELVEIGEYVVGNRESLPVQKCNNHLSQISEFIRPLGEGESGYHLFNRCFWGAEDV